MRCSRTLATKRPASTSTIGCSAVIRLLDLLLSGTSILVLLPLLIPLAITLRFTGEGEVFFRQNRVGRGGEYFQLYKFATMLKDSPNMGSGTVTLKDDPRVLPLGHFLRRTKINELPQLLNIFVGDMSIIGPRPQTQRCFDAFPLESQYAIKQVRPGLSGIGSIIFRDEESLMTEAASASEFYDSVIMPYKGRLEEWFVANRSISIYLKCIALTVSSIAMPKRPIQLSNFKGLPKPPDALNRALRTTAGLEN